MQYSLLLHAPEPGDADVSAEQMAEFQTAFDVYAKSLDSAGVLVAIDILQGSSASTTVAVRDGAPQIQDGPFAATKEQLAGTFVIEVPDVDAAIAWAEKNPGAQYGVVEIRPSAIAYRDGAWQTPA
ncbi:YciI family protein [Conyzicola sp.]|uniref:YciI family protein n=1 Tax=Conyzicola sp. TaxID=1969404 RepID=UPI003989A98B